jgi:uncharacterized ferritin-like protein (DUF455 family)
VATLSLFVFTKSAVSFAMQDSSDKSESETGPSVGDSYIACALKVMNCPNPEIKALWTQTTFNLLQAGKLVLPCFDEHGAAPQRPAVDTSRLTFVPPSQMRNRGKGGSLASRKALLHSLVHIECCAIDLAMDAIARFAADSQYSRAVNEEFMRDFLKVAADEARHFTLLLARLRETGMDYGDLPVHDGLWESAQRTAGSLPARLAVEHCIHEARGLDVLPQTVARFRGNGDPASADLLENVICEEEISHCAAGIKWLRILHGAARRRGADEAQPFEQLPQWVVDARSHDSVESWFHKLVRQHFCGHIKLPVNEEARRRAGFEPSWYMPLATS